jgi:hypothetical protein
MVEWTGQSHGLLIFAILLRLCEEAHLGRRGNPVLCDIKHKLSCLIYQDLDCFTPQAGVRKDEDNRFRYHIYHITKELEINNLCDCPGYDIVDSYNPIDNPPLNIYK